MAEHLTGRPCSCGGRHPTGDRDLTLATSRAQRLDLLRQHARRFALSDTSSYVRFEGLRPGIARLLLTGWPNVDPDDVEGQSPPVTRMVDLAARFGGTLHGNAVLDEPEAPGVIVFDGFEIPKDGRPPEGLLREIGSIPDCLHETEDAGWHFWWDDDPRDLRPADE